MLFPSPIFLFLFLPIVLLGYFAIPKRFKFWKNIFLLVASLFFYAWGEGRYVLVLALMIVINYLLGGLISFKKYSRFWLTISVITNIGFIIYFKYFVFLTSNFLNILFHLHLLSSTINLPAIHMPLGISFITFHCISYCIDVYRKKIKPERKFLDLALYLALFPHLIAGPIVRYASIGLQIKKRRESLEMLSSGIQRFVLGLGKKVIIANTMAKVADKIFSLFPQQITPDILWLGLIAYTLQIFFDFSGYSDMAIGLARMFGFEFAENFNYPYISRSAQEFWRRWHMTLSSWFRDYLYIPLGGNRKGVARTCFNILFVFLLTGFWHGASWHFIFWGLWYGAFMVLERLFLGKILDSIWRPISHLYGLSVIIFGWLFFRVDNLHYSFFLFKELFGLGLKNPRVYTINSFLTPQVIIVLVIGILGSTPIFSYLLSLWQKNKNKQVPAWSYSCGSIVFMVSVLFYSVLLLASDTYNPFIYFRF
jgi:alginate O-acetyltransferase complex protein AlgI